MHTIASCGEQVRPYISAPTFLDSVNPVMCAHTHTLLYTPETTRMYIDSKYTNRIASCGEQVRQYISSTTIFDFVNYVMCTHTSVPTWDVRTECTLMHEMCTEYTRSAYVHKKCTLHRIASLLVHSKKCTFHASMYTFHASMYILYVCAHFMHQCIFCTLWTSAWTHLYT